MSGADTPQLHDAVLTVPVATDARGSCLDVTEVSARVQALTELDPEKVGCVLVVGGTRTFCSGGDVKAFAAAADPAALVAATVQRLNALMSALASVPVPVVAAVPGWAAGAGMSVVCAVDIAVGGPGTKLRPGYPSIGYSPDGGLTWTLPRRIGVGAAREILLRDRVVAAGEAHQRGLLGVLADQDADVLRTAQQLAAELAAGSRGAQRALKGLLARSEGAGLAEQLQAEADSIVHRAASAGGREGTAAFVAKRAAQFDGLD